MAKAKSKSRKVARKPASRGKAGRSSSRSASSSPAKKKKKSVRAASGRGSSRSSAASSSAKRSGGSRASASRRSGGDSRRSTTRGGGGGRGSRSRKQSPGLQELLVLELQEIHSAENQLARLIPRLVKAAESEELQIGLEQRLEEGEQIIADVEEGLEQLGASPGRKKNVAAEGLVTDLREHAQEIEAGPALDTVLIGGVQKTEHYCIAAWGTVKALAEAAGHDGLVAAMERALEEGKSFDEQLTQLAEKEITPALLSGASGDEEDEEDDEEDSGEEDEDEEEELDDEDEGDDEEDDADEDEEDDDSDDDDEDDEDDEEDDGDDEDDDTPDVDSDDEDVDEEEEAAATPPGSAPLATIEEDAENKQEQEEIRGRGRRRRGRGS